MLIGSATQGTLQRQRGRTRAATEGQRRRFGHRQFYGMLPRAHTRGDHAKGGARQRKRSHTKIQRLIGRSAAIATDLETWANGKSRSVRPCCKRMAARVARPRVRMALRHVSSLIAAGKISASPLRAIPRRCPSVLAQEGALLDLDYEEDSTAKTDAEPRHGDRFGALRGGILQGTAEGSVFAREMDRLLELGREGDARG